MFIIAALFSFAAIYLTLKQNYDWAGIGWALSGWCLSTILFIPVEDPYMVEIIKYVGLGWLIAALFREWQGNMMRANLLLIWVNFAFLAGIWMKIGAISEAVQNGTLPQ